VLIPGGPFWVWLLFDLVAFAWLGLACGAHHNILVRTGALNLKAYQLVKNSIEKESCVKRKRCAHYVSPARIRCYNKDVRVFRINALILKTEQWAHIQRRNATHRRSTQITVPITARITFPTRRSLIGF